MKALSLFSGGCDGLSLAGSWVGIETVAFCESDPACRKVLAAIAEADRRMRDAG